MRGGYVHNRILLDPLYRKALRLGAQVDCEAAIKVGDRVLYVDLLIRGGPKQILVEAELSSKRVPNDLAKAAEFGVCELWLVVPNPRIAGSVRRKLLRQSIKPGAELFILLLPQALQRLEEFSPLNSGLIMDSGKESEKKSNAKWIGPGLQTGGRSVRISNGAA